MGGMRFSVDRKRLPRYASGAGAMMPGRMMEMVWVQEQTFIVKTILVHSNGWDRWHGTDIQVGSTKNF